MSRKTFAFVSSFFLLLSSHAEMNFNGSNQYATVPGNSSLHLTTSCTVMAWIRSSPVNVEQAIATQFLTSDLYSGFLLDLGCCGTHGIPAFWIGQWGENWAEGNTAVDDGQWHHIAGRVSGTTVTIFIDGAIDATRTRTSNLVTTADLSIGRRYDTGAYFSGDIGDVRVYNRALSDAEIESIAKSRSRLLVTDGLLGWWKLDDGADGTTSSGASVSDSSGNKNTGTPVNSPIWRASTFINYP